MQKIVVWSSHGPAHEPQRAESSCLALFTSHTNRVDSDSFRESSRAAKSLSRLVELEFFSSSTSQYGIVLGNLTLGLSFWTSLSSFTFLLFFLLDAYVRAQCWGTYANYGFFSRATKTSWSGPVQSVKPSCCESEPTRRARAFFRQYGAMSVVNHIKHTQRRAIKIR